MYRKSLSNENYSRRGFLKSAVICGGTLFMGDLFGIPAVASDKTDVLLKSGIIVVDFEKCTGCRTCETVCASFNHKKTLNGKQVPGLGNPYYSNIRVAHFNPDVDVPIVCSMCGDNPCIDACPVTADAVSKNKALYRNPDTQTIMCDFSRCTGCGRCADACKNEKSGILFLDPKAGFPGRLCTLCNGDPQCITGCPFGALSFQTVDLNDDRYGKSAESTARQLIKSWYGTDMKGGVG